MIKVGNCVLKNQLWFKHGVAFNSTLFFLNYLLLFLELNFLSPNLPCAAFQPALCKFCDPASPWDKRRGVCFCYQHPCDRCLASGMKFSRGCISRWVFFLHLFFVCFRAKWPTHVAGRARTQFLSLHHVLTEGDPCDSGGIQPASLSKH